jgi:hypothetical protein
MLEFANNSYWEDLKHEDSWLKSIIHEGEYWNDEKEKKEYLLRYIWLDLIFSRFDFDVFDDVPNKNDLRQNQWKS